MKKLPSPLILDKEFGPNNIVVAMSDERRGQLSRWEEAKLAFQKADPSGVWFTGTRHEQIPLLPAPSNPFHGFVLSLKKNPPAGTTTDDIVKKISLAGLRPATFGELLAAAIAFPELFKRPVRVIALGSFLGAPAGQGWLSEIKDGYTPYLAWVGGQRTLGTCSWVSPWDENDRFFCAR